MKLILMFVQELILTFPLFLIKHHKYNLQLTEGFLFFIFCCFQSVFVQSDWFHWLLNWS